MSTVTPNAYGNWLYRLLQSKTIFELLTLKEGDIIFLTNSSFILLNMHGILSTVKKHAQHKSFTSALSPPNTLLHYKANSSICYHKVQALTNSYILVFHSISDLSDEFIRNKIRLMELKSLKLHILYLDNLVVLFTQNTIKKRVVVFLLVLAKQIGLFTDNHIIMNITLSHSYIAEALGTTRVSITRSINNLNKKFLVIKRQKIIILNPIALADSALC